jgi:ABC-type proline/glycine betaine transport system permease subunit
MKFVYKLVPEVVVVVGGVVDSIVVVVVVSPEPNVIKLFISAIQNVHNKLKCLSQAFLTKSNVCG